MNESNCDLSLGAKRQLSLEVWHAGWGHSLSIIVYFWTAGVLVYQPIVYQYQYQMWHFCSAGEMLV